MNLRDVIRVNTCLRQSRCKQFMRRADAKNWTLCWVNRAIAGSSNDSSPRGASVMISVIAPADQPRHGR